MEQILKKIYKSRIFGLISILFFIAVCMGIGAFAAYVKQGQIQGNNAENKRINDNRFLQD